MIAEKDRELGIGEPPTITLSTRFYRIGWFRVLGNGVISITATLPAIWMYPSFTPASPPVDDVV